MHRSGPWRGRAGFVVPTSLLVRVLLGGLVAVGAVRSSHANCGQALAIYHAGGGTQGAFVIPELSGNPTGPPMRFWAHGNWASANNGSAGQWREENGKRLSWLLGGAANPGGTVGADRFYLYQANWDRPGVVGCVLSLPDRRTVAEVSYLFDENKPSHYTGYVIASVGMSPQFNFSRVVDGNGGGPALVKMVPIPVPRPGKATMNERSPSHMDVELTLADASSHGDGGAPNLIAGYEILYANDQVPVTSQAAAYQPVVSPGAPTTPLGRVAFGTGSVKVTVRKPREGTYFVVRLVYADPSPLYSNGTSGHSAAVAPPDGEATPTPSATPTPEPEPTPTPESGETAEGKESGAEGGAERNRKAGEGKPSPGGSPAAGGGAAAPSAGASKGASGLPGSGPAAAVATSVTTLGAAPGAGRAGDSTARPGPAGTASGASGAQGPRGPGGILVTPEELRGRSGAGGGALAITGAGDVPGDGTATTAPTMVVEQPIAAGAQGTGANGAAPGPAGVRGGAATGSVTAKGGAELENSGAATGTRENWAASGRRVANQVRTRIGRGLAFGEMSPWRVLDLGFLASFLVLGYLIWLGRRG